MKLSSQIEASRYLSQQHLCLSYEELIQKADALCYKTIIDPNNGQHMLYFRPKKNDETANVNDLISSLLFELKNKKIGYEHICKGYLFRLFTYIASEYQYTYTKEEQDSLRKYLFNEVKLFLFHHFADIQIQDLVDSFHYQRNYFNRLIKEFTGLTYSEYLIEVRILQAKHLLKTTAYNIEEIMMLVGYHNKGFFYSNFKKICGMNPAEYRKTEEP